MRAAAIALLVAAGCGTTRPVEAPQPYDDSGILVTVEPRVYVDWPLGLETIRGTAENRTGHDVDLQLYLSLVDGKGAIVGHAYALNPCFRKGAKWRFEAYTGPGPPELFNLSLFAKPPPYSRVERGFVCDLRAVTAFAEYVIMIATPVVQLAGWWVGALGRLVQESVADAPQPACGGRPPGQRRSASSAASSRASTRVRSCPKNSFVLKWGSWICGNSPWISSGIA